MAWFDEINIDNVVIVAAQFGGPIAVIRDRSKPGRTAMKGIGKPVIAIYSATGYLISSFVVSLPTLIPINITHFFIIQYFESYSGTVVSWFDWAGHPTKISYVYKKTERCWFTAYLESISMHLEWDRWIWANTVFVFGNGQCSANKLNKIIFFRKSKIPK